jgi:hypothetical protein
MGSTGMAMGEMEMPIPDNTLMMMSGSGQFGPIEMGGMFTVMEIREGLARDDYKDPGPYKNPQGTVAYEIETPQSEAPRQTEKDKPTREPGSKVRDMKGMDMKGMKGM